MDINFVPFGHSPRQCQAATNPFPDDQLAFPKRLIDDAESTDHRPRPPTHSPPHQAIKLAP